MTRKGRRNDLETEIRRGLDRLGRKADQCDRLLESLAAERRRPAADVSEAVPNHDLRKSDPLTVLAREATSLREGQLKLLQMIERLQMDLAEERRLRESLLAELRSRGLALSSISPSQVTQSQAPTAIPSDPEGAKYKELKKKLLMANLRILELQSAKSGK